MGKFNEQQRSKEERKEKERTRLENLGKFIYDLAKLIFASIVLGGFLPLFSDTGNVESWTKVISGFFLTFLLATWANNTLKK